jgi:hypothetical protein
MRWIVVIEDEGACCIECGEYFSKDELDENGCCRGCKNG